MSARSFILFAWFCGACATETPSAPSPAPAAAAPAPAAAAPAPAAAAPAPAEPQPAGEPDMPFVSDAVSVSELGAAGWTCAANEIENMDCNRPMDVEGVGAAQISVMPTPAGQVSLINLTASQPALTPASSVLLGDTLAALAASHGWSCEPSSELGTMRPCTKDGATIQIELFPNQGYAMASVRAPGLEGQMND